MNPTNVLPIEKRPRTEAQQNASRNNGTKSKGPVTAQGKYHSSQSALRHGLTATKFTLLNHEDPAQYIETMAAFIADFQPATKAELRLANLDWRMERFTLMETSLFNLAVLEQTEKITASSKASPESAGSSKPGANPTNSTNASTSWPATWVHSSTNTTAPSPIFTR